MYICETSDVVKLGLNNHVLPHWIFKMLGFINMCGFTFFTATFIHRANYFVFSNWIFLHFECTNNSQRVFVDLKYIVPQIHQKIFSILQRSPDIISSSFPLFLLQMLPALFPLPLTMVFSLTFSLTLTTSSSGILCIPVPFAHVLTLYFIHTMDLVMWLSVLTTLHFGDYCWNSSVCFLTHNLI